MQLVFFPSFPARFVHLWSLSFNDIFLYVCVPIDSYPSPKRRGKRKPCSYAHGAHIYIPRSIFIYIFSLRVAGDVLVCAVKRLWEMGAYLQNFGCWFSSYLNVLCADNLRNFWRAVSKDKLGNTAWSVGLWLYLNIANFCFFFLNLNF